MPARASALDSPPTTPATAPRARTANDWLDEAWRLRAAGNAAGARAAFEEARRAGAEPQLVDMELGYLALGARDFDAVRRHFESAARGPDAERARRARAELKNIPPRFWGELYGDAVGFHRLAPTPLTNLVPTLRLRALVRPSRALDLHLFLFGQFTRDAASTSRTPMTSSVVFADDFALLGGGAMVRFLQSRIGLFAQAAVAFNLLDDGSAPIQLDVRAGLFGQLASPACTSWPGATGRFCGELYFESVYVSRFDHNAIALVRPRLGYNVLRTGPILWQPMFEARLAVDINGNYWNNFLEAGLIHRFRLASPVGADLSLGIHAGTWLDRTGPSGKTPADPLYAELRVLFTTYFTTDVFRD